MTVTATTTESPTAVQILFGSGDDAVDPLADSLDESAVVSTLGTAFSGLAKAGRKAMGREVAAVVARLLDLEFSRLLLAAWRKHDALAQAGRRTFEAPGAQEVVELLAHRITSAHRPSVDLSIDGVRLATLNFELQLSFLVEGLIATVYSGELVQIDSGNCDVAATLACEEIEIARGKGHFELPLAVRLEEPLRLWPKGKN